MKDQITRSILVVDDDRAMREMLCSLLEDRGYTAVGAGSGDEALASLDARNFDAVMSDIRMPGMDGLELLGAIHTRRPDLPVILMTAFGNLDTAIAAMRAGAFDYITKPFKREEVLVVLERAFERQALERENRQLRRAVDKTASFGELLGESAAMREIFALLRKVSDSMSSVLITGESGTGKEVVARTLHFTSARADKPFIPINCTAIPEGLLESELFGHVKGSFTGASSNKRGLFEEASGGTLFLDEIGDMGGGLQSKLLRVLQDGEVRAVGATNAVKVDVRIVAATNKDLEEEMNSGHFRRDLYYRLNVIPIHIPPLRERPEDVAILAKAFVSRHSTDPRCSLTTAAIEVLQRQPWEGNARELENTIERSLLLADSKEIGPSDLALPGGSQSSQPTLAQNALEAIADQRLSLHDLERLYTELILERCGGNKVQAARILGINRRTLYRRAERAEKSQAASNG